MLNRSLLLLGAVMVMTSANTILAAVLTEDFSSGNPVSFSDYTLVNQGTQSAPTDYRVVNDPSTALRGVFKSYYDHTLGAADGSMLFFDGAPTSSTRIWYQNVSLSAGTLYSFSYWGSCADVSGSVPTLDESLSGVTLPGGLVTSYQIWSQFSDDITVPTTGPGQTHIRVSTRNSAAKSLPRPASLRKVVVTCVTPIGISYCRKLARTDLHLVWDAAPLSQVARWRPSF